MEGTKKEMLDVINKVIKPKILELIKDLGCKKIEFTPEGCVEFKITFEGNLYFKNNNGDYNMQSDEYDFSGSEPDAVRRVMLAYAKKLTDLRREKQVLKDALEEVRNMGCFADSFERDLLTEKKGSEK